MNARSLLTPHKAALSAAALALAAGPANGHITVDGPNGGEVFEVGSVVTITWHITISHTLLNWDLVYSHVNPGCAPNLRSCLGVGPWTVIASNLPAGSPAVGSVHTYDWTIPEDAANDTVWIRVYMDNAATDYTDFNNGPFSIVAGCPWDCDGNDDGVVGVTDLLALLGQFDPMSPDNCTGGSCDFDGSGCVDVVDLLKLLAHYDPAGVGCP